MAGIGFGISAVLSAELELSRDLLVLGYFTVLTVLLSARRSRHLQVFRTRLRHNLATGVVAGLLIGALLGITVAQQPGSRAPDGLQLFWSLIWLGLVYGLLDGLLLNVLPVIALARADAGRVRSWFGWRVSVLGLAASAVVTAAYHVGYREFRGSELVQPLIGNTIITTGFLITGNAAAPLIAHVIMHGAAVLHGMETTSRLPPHYSGRDSSGFTPRRLPSGGKEDSDR